MTFLTICLIFIPRPKSRSASSIILRGANDFMLDEMERSLHDAICVVKRVLESKTVVPGGGAVEAALSIYLENFATSLVKKTFCTLLGLISTFFFYQLLFRKMSLHSSGLAKQQKSNLALKQLLYESTELEMKSCGKI